MPDAMKLSKCIVILIFPSFTWSQSIQEYVDQVNIDSLMQSIYELSGEVPVVINGTQRTIDSRYWNEPGNAWAQDYLIQRLENYGWTVFQQTFNAGGKNIIARKYGTIYPGKKIILGGHFDSMPPGDSPGADDNATGTAAVLETARILQDASFPYTLELVLWDEEEYGLLGSAHYVDELTLADTLIAVYNLDMLGYDANQDDRVMIHTVSNGCCGMPATIAATAAIEYAPQLDVYTHFDGVYSSDHIPYQNGGFPAIGMTEDYQQDMNPAWHTAADIPDSLDRDYFEQCTRWAIGTILLTQYSTEFQSQGKIMELTAAPNPIESFVTLYVRLEQTAAVELGLYSTAGERIADFFSGELSAGYHEFRMELPQLAPGTYLAGGRYSTEAGGKGKLSVKLVHY